MKKINTWWTLDPAPGNMGDILTPFILRAYGYQVNRVPRREEVEWLFVGSTIRFARPGTRVVGTGLIDRKDIINSRANYLAVRGPITANAVRKAGCNAPSILGDPALLLPRLYTPRVSVQDEVGFIPHYIDHTDSRVSRWPGKLINILRENPLDVVDDICACKRIVSSSLHGIIVAHAYGIPAAWVRLGDRLCGDDIKFADYAESVDIRLNPYGDPSVAQAVLPKTLKTDDLHYLFLSLADLDK